METREKRVVVEHVEKEVIVDTEKQMCRWMCMAKCYNENVMVTCQ
jgi:hypothetical protein